MREELKQIPLSQIIQLAEKVEKWERYWNTHYIGSFKDIDFKIIGRESIFSDKIKWYKISAEHDSILLSEYEIKAGKDLRIKELYGDIEFYVKKQEQNKMKSTLDYIKKFVEGDEIKIKKGKIKLSLDAILKLAERVQNWKRTYGRYEGSIKNKGIKICVSNRGIGDYSIGVNKGNILDCYYVPFITGKNKSKIKKLYKSIKSNWVQKEEEIRQQEQEKARNKSKNAFDYTNDLLNKVGII